MQQNFTNMKVQNKSAGNTPNALKNGKANKDETIKVKKPKQKKKKRLIIRNLSFKVEEDELKEIFSKFGKLKEVKIPLKEDGKKRGFGFVEFEDTRSLIKAMKTMNWKEIQGRKVAVDFAVDKNTYQLKVQAMKQEGKNVPVTNDGIKSESEIKQESDSDENGAEDEIEEEDEDEKKLNDFLKEFDSGAEKLTKIRTEKEQTISSEESSDEESEEEDSDEEEECAIPKKKIKQEHDTSSSPTKKAKTKDSHDVNEKKTVFLRNVSFASSQDSLREAMEEFGECEYCLLCMDQFTDHPKGTAFVKFKEKDCAEKLIKESFGEPGVLVDGRKLICSYAMSREDVSHVGDDTKKPKDKRNLNLLRIGLIMPNSKESEGVTPSDMAKRSQLEIVKKQKLRNVNFFVSDTRLMIHNLPKTYTDDSIRKLFKKAAGRGAAITEARVMKEFKKIDEKGNPLSKGYGFVRFTNHEDALKALNELNNNPSIFTSQKRPIVEFSVENKVALLSQERRKEKMQSRNKRRTEEKRERQLNQDLANADKASSDILTKGKKRKRKNKNNKPAESTKKDPQESKDVAAEESNPITQKKKTRKRPKQSRKGKKLTTGDANMTNLVNKFKDKLINKIT